jgi:subtilisin family serine protease
MEKIIGIIITTLLIATAVLPVNGMKINNNIKLNENQIILNPLTNEFEYLQSTSSQNFPQTTEYEPGELVVKLKDNVDVVNYVSSELISVSKSVSEIYQNEIVKTGIESIDILNKKFNILSIERLIGDDSIQEFSNVYIFRFNEDLNVISVADAYINNSNVEYAEPNYFYHFCNIPNDSYFDEQWALHNTGQRGGTPDADIDAPEAWDIEQGSSDIIVAVIDSGVDYTNPDIGNYTSGITEEEYNLESSHPLPLSGYEKTVTFPECDAVSFHISKFDVDPLWLLSFIVSNNMPLKLLSKQLFSGYFYNGSASDIWTKFSEYGSGNTINIKATGEGLWGFAIDKVKKLKWKPLNDISDKYVDGYDYYYNNPDPMDDNGHGTHCAGIIGAVTNNDYGIAGISGNCKIMPIKVTNPVPGFTTMTTLLRAIVFAVNHGADIISMSLGGKSASTAELGISYANKNGVVLVGAAGNANKNNKDFSFPAGHKNVIAVSATDNNDSKAWFSDYGSWVDVAAPGVDILSLRAYATDMYLIDTSQEPGKMLFPAFDNNATLYRASGTSMACPHVAGVAALILSKNPDLTPMQLKTVLRSSTDKVDSNQYIGTGRINAYNALLKTAPVIAHLDESIDDIYAKGNVEIKGIAEGEQLNRYIVDYAYGIYPDDDSWTEISSSSEPKDGVLATLDTSGFQEGLYTVRLNVNASGFNYFDMAVFKIDNKANTFYVDDDNIEGPWFGTDEHPFNNVQYGIECCGSSDKVFVYSGIYTESLYFGKGKTVKIVGENKNSTILDGGKIISNAINMLQAKSITFTGFTISNYTYGITGQLCFSNKIVNNCLRDNGYGMFLIQCYNNKIYGNNFINNSDYHATTMYGQNNWHSSLLLKGNYWDDYDGEDILPPKGVGDTPYTIPGINFFNNDKYPLMKPNYLPMSKVLSNSKLYLSNILLNGFQLFLERYPLLNQFLQRLTCF